MLHELIRESRKETEKKSESWKENQKRVEAKRRVLGRRKSKRMMTKKPLNLVIPSLVSFKGAALEK